MPLLPPLERLAEVPLVVGLGQERRSVLYPSDELGLALPKLGERPQAVAERVRRRETNG